MNETPAGVERKLHSLASKVGYGLLLMAFAGYAEQFASPHFENALWKFQVMGGLVDNSPMLLLALFLVFYEGPNSPSFPFERHLRRCLSWLCLVLGILFFVLVPLQALLWLDIDEALGRRSSAEVSKADKLEEQLKNAKPEARDEYLKQGNSTPEAVRAAAMATWRHQRVTGDVKCFKWSVGALAAGTVCICIWNASRWTRRKPRRHP